MTGDYHPEQASLAWELAHRAMALVQTDPHGLGGVVLHGRHGPAREALLTALADQGAGQGRTLRRLPPGTDEAALVGGLDTTASLARGEPVYTQGLLDSHHDRLLLLSGAERVSQSVATVLCQWLDGHDRSTRRESRAPLIALDESLESSGLLESALGERLGLHVAVPELAQSELRTLGAKVVDSLSRQIASTEPGPGSPVPTDIGKVYLSDDRLDGIVRLADQLGIVSLRAPHFACRAARVIAWLDGRDAVTDDDAAVAVQLVLAPRARRLPDEPAPVDADEEQDTAAADESAADRDDDVDDEPASEADSSPEPADPPAAEPAAQPGPLDKEPAVEQELNEAQDDQALPERLIAAVAAALPRNLLDELTTGRVSHQAATGRDSGARAATELSGRPIGTRRPRGGNRQRPDLLATLKAAIPHQRLRAIDADGFDPVARGERPALRIRRDDFRVTRYRRPTRTTTLFVVDASGSAAMHRLAEAKGAVESLLAECYVRRDRVALVTFRGESASLDLPPTRSLVRARRALAGLPGGGGTPLAAGLDLAAEQLERIAAAGESPVAVIMTDGRANVSRDGSGGRAQAREDAEQASRRLAQTGARLLFVDTGPRPRPAPRQLAALMGARYLALPQLGDVMGGAPPLNSRSIDTPLACAPASHSGRRSGTGAAG